VLKLAKKVFPLDRAIVIAILLSPSGPAPVVAQALGFHDKTTSRVAAEAGTLEPLRHWRPRR
jgi:hypothetical protein